MNEKALNEVLAKHKKWLNHEEGGERADLKYTYLRVADLSYADLRGADLRGTKLRCADLGHRCKYCGQSTESMDEDVLCGECQTDFGHTFYSEL